MNIVFFLGNGFDLNLDLKTSYSSFLSNYIIDNQNNPDVVIRDFIGLIEKDRNGLWSDVELALGKCSLDFEKRYKNPAQEYKKCYESMLKSLVEYLQLIEAGLPKEVFDKECVEAFAVALKSFDKGQKRTDRERIKRILDKAPDGQNYNVISFNYTHFVDYMLEIYHKYNTANNIIFGTRLFNGYLHGNSWKNLIHVHGDISEDIIFGVDNEKQIPGKSIIENEYFKKQLLKMGADEYIGKAYDSDAYNVLKNADVIYLYGASIGETDAIWWERINSLLADNPNCILILHSYELKEKNKKEILLSDREENIDNIKKQFLQFGANTQETNDRIMKQIYIDTSNIFDSFAKTIKNKLDLYWKKQLGLTGNSVKNI